MDKKLVLALLTDKFADWEISFIASALNSGINENGSSKYCIKTLSATTHPVCSMGGLTLMPDYSLETVPEDFAAILLIGGQSWKNLQTKLFVDIVQKAYTEKKVIGAICDATLFLARHGFLNSIKHTGNSLEYTSQYAGDKYRGQSNYISSQAVRDSNIITANGTAYLEFSKEVLYALDAYASDDIEQYYYFYSTGYCDIMKLKNN